MLYCSTHISHKRRDDLESINIESLWVEITHGKDKNILVGVYYRAPGQNAAEIQLFMDEFAASVLAASASGADSIVIMGDFNDRCTDWSGNHGQSELRNKFRDLCMGLGLLQMIDSPTHINNEGMPDHILDLILTDNHVNIEDTQIISPMLNCDHCFISCKFRFNILKQKGTQRKVWNFKEADFEGLNNALVSVPWNAIIGTYMSTDEKIESFTNLLLDTIKTFVPFNI